MKFVFKHSVRSPSKTPGAPSGPISVPRRTTDHQAAGGKCQPLLLFSRQSLLLYSKGPCPRGLFIDSTEAGTDLQ